MIPVKKLFLVAFVVFFLISGCLENGGEEVELSPSEMSPGITKATLSSPNINPDRPIRVEARVENNNLFKAEDIEVEISGLYPLSLDEGEETVCEIEELDPYLLDTDIGGGIDYCEWDIVCDTDECITISENYPQPYTVDFDLEISYETEVADVEEGLEVRFLPLEDLREDDISEETYVGENGDISITSSYKTPVPAEEEKFHKDLRIENVGRGSLVDEEIEIDYSGTLLGKIDNPDECGSLFISEDRISTETTCTYSISDTLPENVYDLVVRGNYKYEEQENIEIDIT